MVAPGRCPGNRTRDHAPGAPPGGRRRRVGTGAGIRAAPSVRSGAAGGFASPCRVLIPRPVAGIGARIGLDARGDFAEGGSRGARQCRLAGAVRPRGPIAQLVRATDS